MTKNSKIIAVAATALMIMAAPATVLGQTAPGGNPNGSSSADSGAGHDGNGGTYGFGSTYHNFEYDISQRCDFLRKRAQWSDNHFWWTKYSRCTGR